jgi:hypothetical protein
MGYVIAGCASIALAYQQGLLSNQELAAIILPAGIPALVMWLGFKVME